jgi:hypothetical protein
LNCTACAHCPVLHNETELLFHFLDKLLSVFFHFSPRPLFSLFDPSTAPSRPLTALNFSRPPKFFYGHFWAKGPWRRPPGNPVDRSVASFREAFTSVARSHRAFTATSAQNHGHLATFHGHKIVQYGYIHRPFTRQITFLRVTRFLILHKH